jgi:hypothetical protein
MLNLRKNFLNTFFLIALVLLAPLSKLLSFNWQYFDVSLLEVVLAVMAISVFFALLLLPVSFSKRFATLSFDALSVMLVAVVVSVYFMPINLSAVDGADVVDFVVRHEALSIVFVALALFLLYVCIAIFSEHWFVGMKKTLSFLTLLASFYVLAFFAYAALQAPSYFSFTGPGEEEYKLPLSPDKNIFIIGFDQVQGSLVHGLLDNDSGSAYVFDGFTFFTDAAATYPNTNYSLSSIVLGRVAESQAESYKAVADSAVSILQQAKASGYSAFTASYNSVSSAECLTCSDSAAELGYNWPKVYEALRHAFNLGFGFDLNRFLPLPQTFSGVVPNDMLEHSWKLDLHKFESLAEGFVIKNDAPSLYFMHFLGTHQPFTYDSSCEIYSKSIMDVNQSLIGALDSANCVVSLLAGFFEALKKSGLYDSSTIFVYSDHGYEANINMLASIGGNEGYFRPSAEQFGDSRNIKPVGSYNPALFYKPAGVRGALVFSDAPVSVIDIAPTVCETIGCETEWHGKSLNSISEDERQRDFWLYLGGRDRRTADGKDKLHDGLDQFWEKRSFTGPIYPNLAFAMGLSKSDFYKALGTQQVVYFDREGSSAVYVSSGWSGQESQHRWTDGPKAAIQFRIQDFAERDLVLRLNANGYLGGGLPHQNVGVVVNGTQVAEWQVAGVAEHTAVIPANLVGDDGLINLSFDIGDPRAPCDFSESTDCRKLGMAVRELVVDYVQ